MIENAKCYNRIFHIGLVKNFVFNLLSNADTVVNDSWGRQDRLRGNKSEYLTCLLHFVL